MESFTAQDSIKIVRLEHFTFRQAVDLWNAGFSGYYSDMTMTIERYIGKLARDSIRPDLSVVAVEDGVPAGFVLIAFKSIDGVKIAWNGGTGVSPVFRSRGIAKRLMREAVRVMEEEGACTSLLEVVQKNRNAVAVYESAGFRIADRIIGMKREGALSPQTYSGPGEREARGYRIVPAEPWRIAKLPFYRQEAAWTCQWHNMAGDDGYVLYDREDCIAAYALARKKYDDSGKPASITLFQCEADPRREDRKHLIAAVLETVFGPPDCDWIRQTENLSTADPTAFEWLEAAGFETVYTQFLMIRERVS
ncbi:hypothetical protein J31TS4_04140 [Paenibacillus sp. J31TS4]|uniref:GNAT family N-acetyltransferase n=1 Tax=Paenibacillus sp. J31TS4 TaxID=2807195 RepID=UPI001B21BD9C|nr:GNAT family N-acetyltransferase [Paenibacillus sp. J31TS4]GIP37134.1 hypothetical protein J31TS4_04140 [Paenibacillus sp. J31TS4]